jgi:hypothetical protein
MIEFNAEAAIDDIIEECQAQLLSAEHSVRYAENDLARAQDNLAWSEARLAAWEKNKRLLFNKE